VAQDNHLAQLIMDVKESLERELRQGFSELNEKLDRQDTRLSRHGGLLQGGARQITRMVEWSERWDDLLAQRDARLNQLERRVADLEKRLQEKP